MKPPLPKRAGPATEFALLLSLLAGGLAGCGNSGEAVAGAADLAALPAQQGEGLGARFVSPQEYDEYAEALDP